MLVHLKLNILNHSDDAFNFFVCLEVSPLFFFIIYFLLLITWPLLLVVVNRLLEFIVIISIAERRRILSVTGFFKHTAWRFVKFWSLGNCLVSNIDT